MEQIWKQTLQVLEHCLDPGVFTIWVSRLRAEFDGDTLRIQATNTFVAGWIQNKLGDTIAQAAGDVLGFVPKLEFETLKEDMTASVAPTPLPLQRPASHDYAIVPSHSGVAATNIYSAQTIHSDQPAQSNQSGNTPDWNAPSQAFPLSVCGNAFQKHPADLSAPENFLSPDSFGALDADASAHSVNFPHLVKTAPCTNISGAPSEELIRQLSLPVTYQGLDRRAERARSQWRYSFEDFVVGPSNELAYAASKNICASSQHMDVLFLNSAPGLGKTHLLQASGKMLALASNKQALRAEYLTAEEFCSQLFAAIKNRSTDSFKARFRAVDLLLMEDVHFLQGKEKMQDELLATLKSINEKGGRVALSSSFSPSELRDMDDQLISRLSSGLIARIERPDHETRIKIIKEKSRLHQVKLSDNVTELLASRIRNDVRQIEGCLQNLILKAKILNSEVTMSMALETLKSYSSEELSLTFEEIVNQICSGFGLSQEQLNSRSRKREYVQARNAAYYLARKHTDMSLQQIGYRFNRKHSSVLKGITSLEQEISRESVLGRQLQRAITLIERNGGIHA